MAKSEHKTESEELYQTRNIHQGSDADAVYLGVKLQRIGDKLDKLIALLTPPSEEETP